MGLEVRAVCRPVDSFHIKVGMKNSSVWTTSSLCTEALSNQHRKRFPVVDTKLDSHTKT